MVLRSLAPLRTVTVDEIGCMDCVLNLPMNEGNGSIVYDKSGYNNHGTVYGAIWVGGKYGRALQFDGIDDQVDLASTIVLPGEVSITAWFNKADSAASRMLISRNVSGNEKILFWTDNRLGVRIATGGTIVYKDIGYTASMDGSWHFLAVVRDSSNEVKVSLDGGPLISFGVSAGTSRWDRIGRNPPDNQNWKGIIDGVRIYNRALSPDEVKAIYLGSRLPPSRSLGVVR